MQLEDASPVMAFWKLNEKLFVCTLSHTMNSTLILFSFFYHFTPCIFILTCSIFFLCGLGQSSCSKSAA